jgi:flagellar biosynthetic protein FliR
MVTIVEYLPQQAFALIFIFARVGAMLMLVAGIGEAFISERIRLGIALGIALLLVPIIPVPAVPSSPLMLFILLAGEVLIGVFFGLLARFMMAAMDMAGMIIGAQSGLANAMIFNPAAATQGALVGYFISMIAVMGVLAMDLHHLAIAAIKDSYFVFIAGAAPPDQDTVSYTHLTLPTKA